MTEMDRGDQLKNRTPLRKKVDQGKKRRERKELCPRVPNVKLRLDQAPGGSYFVDHISFTK
jgi:hypothetical protein